MTEKIIGIVGFIGAGKGTIGDYLVNQHNFRAVSFASALKDICAALFHWPRDLLEGNTEESRQWRELPDIWWSNYLGVTVTPRWALQNIGTDLFRQKFHGDIWTLSLRKCIETAASKNIVVTDARFPNEIKMIRELNGQIWWVKRDLPNWYNLAKESPEQMSQCHLSVHPSEYAWLNCGPFIEIDNTSTLDKLQSQIDKLI